MDNLAPNALAPHAFGIVLSLLSIVWGFALGGLMGAMDSDAKDMLRQRANRVLATVYGGDEQKRETVVSKAWKYCIRAHIHGGSIGTAALAAILLLAQLGEAGWLERASSLAFGAGALIYSIYWLVAGIRTVDMGSPKAAKHSLGFIAIPGAGLALLGLFGTLVATVMRLF